MTECKKAQLGMRSDPDRHIYINLQSLGDITRCTNTLLENDRGSEALPKYQQDCDNAVNSFPEAALSPRSVWVKQKGAAGYIWYASSLYTEETTFQLTHAVHFNTL